MKSYTLRIFLCSLCLTICQCSKVRDDEANKQGFPHGIVLGCEYLDHLYLEGDISDFRWLEDSNHTSLTLTSHELVTVKNLPKTIRELTLRNTQLENLDGLEHLPNLEKLTLINNTKLADLSMIPSIKRLEELRIEKNASLKITDPLAWKSLSIVRLKVLQTTIGRSLLYSRSR